MRAQDMNRRSTDQSGSFPFRAERFFTEQGAWYCSTREGTLLGPFVDRKTADSALTDYLLDLRIQMQDVWDSPSIR
jgi:hypothetical protein